MKSLCLLLAEDHETDFEFEVSDNEEEPANEGEPRFVVKTIIFPEISRSVVIIHEHKTGLKQEVLCFPSR